MGGCCVFEPGVESPDITVSVVAGLVGFVLVLHALVAPRRPPRKDE